MRDTEIKYRETQNRNTYIAGGLAAAVLLFLVFWRNAERSDATQKTDLSTTAAPLTKNDIPDNATQAMVEQLQGNASPAAASVLSFVKQHQSEIRQSTNIKNRLNQLISEISGSGDDKSALPPNSVAGVRRKIERKIFASSDTTNADFETELAIEIKGIKAKYAIEESPLSKSVEKLRSKIVEIERQIRETATSNEKKLSKLKRQAALEDDYDEIVLLLKPFISKGYNQPKGRGINIETTIDKNPVSFSRLQQHGHLERTKDGVLSLYKFGGSFFRKSTNRNDRPLGTFPDYEGDYLIGQGHIVEPVKRAQVLLKQHGQALVDQGMLLP